MSKTLGNGYAIRRTFILLFLLKGYLGRLPELRNMTDLGMLFYLANT